MGESSHNGLKLHKLNSWPEFIKMAIVMNSIMKIHKYN